MKSETTLQRLSFEASLLLPNWPMVEENSSLFVWCASQLPWNYLLLVRSKRKPNETQKDLPSIILSSSGLVIVSLKQSQSLHYLGILLHFDHSFFFIEIWGIHHKIDLSYVSMQFLFLLFFIIFSRLFNYLQYLNSEYFHPFNKKQSPAKKKKEKERKKPSPSTCQFSHLSP